MKSFIRNVLEGIHSTKEVIIHEFTKKKIIGQSLKYRVPIIGTSC